MSTPSIRDVIERHRKTILAVPGVQGVAAGRHPTKPGMMCITVYIMTQTRPAGIPENLEGFDVATETTSGFRAL